MMMMMKISLKLETHLTKGYLYNKNLQHLLIQELIEMMVPVHRILVVIILQVVHKKLVSFFPTMQVLENIYIYFCVAVNGTGFLKTDKNLLKRSRGSTSTSRTPASKLSVIDLSFRLDEKLRYKELLERSSFHLDDDSHSFGKNFPSDYSRGRKMVDACKIRQKIFDVIDLTDDSSKRYNFKKSSSTAKAVKKVLDDFDNDAIVVKDSDSDIEIFTDPPSPKSDFKVERLNSLKSVVESCEFSKKKWLKDE